MHTLRRAPGPYGREAVTTMKDNEREHLEAAARHLNEYAGEAGDMDGHDLAERVERLQSGEDPLPGDGIDDPREAATDGGSAVVRGDWLRRVQHDTAEWREETIEGDTTPLSQAAHSSVEAAEVLDLLVKDETYGGSWATEDVELRRELKVECGDVIVSHLGTMSLLGLDVVECVEAAMEKNGSREWAGWQEGPSR